MKKIIILFSLFSMNVYATDLINLYDRAKQHNINILNNQIDVDIAYETLRQTKSSVFPEINFSAQASETTIERYKSAGSYDPADYDRDSYNLSIRQPLIHLYVFDEIKKANSVLQQNEISKNDADSLLILESARHYFNLIKFKNLVDINEAKNDYQRARLSASKKLFDNGSISIEDYEMYQNIYDESINDVKISKDNLSKIKNDVYIFSGKELNDINDIKLANIKHQTFILDELINSALTNNNSIRISKQNMKISRNEIAAQKSRHYPTVDIIAEYDYLDITQGGSQFGATTREDSSISLVLNFPIFNGGYQSSKIREARMNYKKARLDHNNSRRLVRKEIMDSFNIYNTSKNLYETSLKVLTTSLKRYENAQNGFDKGIYTDTQVLEAKIDYLQSLAKSKEIMMDYVYSEMTLEYLQNNLDVSLLRKVNSYLVW